MPQTGFNWTWAPGVGMKATATPEEERRLRVRSPFARGTLQTGFNQPPRPPGDDDDWTDEELADLDEADAEEAAYQRKRLNRPKGGQPQGKPAPGQQGIPLPPWQGQPPPGPEINPWGGVGLRPADLGRPPGQGPGQPPGPGALPEGWELESVPRIIPGTNTYEMVPRWRRSKVEKPEKPEKDTLVANIGYEDGPTDDTYYEVRQNEAGKVLSRRLVSKESVVDKREDTTKKGPIFGPPGYEDIEGDDENQWEIWQDANGNEISRRKVPRETKEAKAAEAARQEGIEAAAQRGFKPKSVKVEGGTWHWATNDAGDTISGTQRFVPEEKKKSDVWQPVGEPKKISVMPGGQRPDGTTNDTGVVEEVAYQTERNMETGQNRQGVIDKRRAVEAAYQGMRQEAGLDLEALSEMPWSNLPGNLQTTRLGLESEAAEEATTRRLMRQSGVDRAQTMTQPRNWIGRTPNPVVPSNLANIIGQPAGQPLKPIPPPRPSAQQWSRMTEQDKEMFFGYLQWVGIDAAQWLIELSEQWNSGARIGPSVVWATPRDR